MAKRTSKSASPTAGGVETLTPPRRQELKANRLHPVQVEFSYPIGSRIDMVDKLPLDLEEEDIDEWIDRFSSPREYEERIAPVSADLNQEKLTSKNPSELQVKFIRKLAKRLELTAKAVAEANKENFGETGPVACVGFGVDPDTINRIIELDYETADNVYSRIARLWDEGHATPIVTIPFHTMLPLYQHDFEIRMLCRIALEFYWPVLKKYNNVVARNHRHERYFMCVLWLPEGAINARVLEMFHAEFVKRCEEEKIEPWHLVILLDCEQSGDREPDLLMKRWNTLRPAPTTRDIVSVVYKERLFSDWMIQGHPSTKKQLDRTIAKVDAVSRDNGIDHLWSHFEPLMTLLSTFKTAYNFEQKLIKLTELGYQPCGPDVFIRRKLLDMYGMDDSEPRRTTILDNTVWNSYPDTPGSMVRFLGYEDDLSNRFNPKRVLGKERHYSRRMLDGTSRKSRGNPCWKPALWAALRNVHRAIVGEPKTFMGGMLGLLRQICPVRRVPVAMRNIEEFLVIFSRVHWKEHFIHHVYSEADIRLEEFARNCLLANLPEDAERTDLTDQEVLVAGVAAEAIYHAHLGLSSTTFAWEHLDHRAAYNNLAMMTLGVIHAIHALKWMGMDDEADKIFQVFKTEMLEFDQAYERHGIDKLGVEQKMWRATIKSQVADSDLNLVERVARRLGAIHLRMLGYRNDFDRKDESISTACGHIWSHEIDHLNFKWENELFCGLAEE